MRIVEVAEANILHSQPRFIIPPANPKPDQLLRIFLVDGSNAAGELCLNCRNSLLLNMKDSIIERNHKVLVVQQYVGIYFDQFVVTSLFLPALAQELELGCEGMNFLLQLLNFFVLLDDGLSKPQYFLIVGIWGRQVLYLDFLCLGGQPEG